MLSGDVRPGFRSVGQVTARKMARNAVLRGWRGRTLLIHGPPGSGKGAFVEDLLALLLCAAPDPMDRPCNTCRGCREARARSHPDLVIGSPERWREARSTGESIVAAARRWLADAAGAPIVAEQRVVLVEGADRAGEQIQNALLKVLEEPSARHCFLLVADDPSRLLPTIRSRCQPLRIGRVPREELAAWLGDHERLPADQAVAVARLADGLVGRASAYARDPDQLAWRRRVQTELLSLLDRSRADRLGSARELLDEASRRVGVVVPADVEEGLGDGETPRTPTAVQRVAGAMLVDAWIALTRDLLVAAAGRPEAAALTEMLPDLQAAAHRVPTSQLADFVRLLERVREGLDENSAPRLALDVAMLAWPSPGSQPQA